MEFKDRLKQARTKKGLSQGELAKAIQVHVTNISRYERGENKPTSEVLSKLANALDTQADTEINDKELLSQFKQVEQLNPADKHLVKTFIDAFLTKRQIQQLA